MTTDTQVKTSPPPVEAPPLAAGERLCSRRYIYCIIDGDLPTRYGPMGIDGESDVFAVPHQGRAAVVSSVSAQKVAISRPNAVAHQRVMEAAMQRGHVVLPVRFNTIAEETNRKTAEQRIIDHVLVGKRHEILDLLSTMRGVVEIGVKGLWTDMEAVFRDIVERHPEIQSLRRKLLAAGGPGGARRGPPTMAGQVRLGEMVKKALEARKRDKQAALLGRLAPLARESKTNTTFGDAMFVNLALLVDEPRQQDVEGVLSAFEAEEGGLVKLRCVGPLPPCNFLELVITWDD
jgi:hypothetical protein